MKICVIAGNYPSEGNPKHVFLEKIVKEFVDQGNECVVIAPQTKNIRKSQSEYSTDCGNSYAVFSPMYHGFSGRKIGPIHFGSLTQRSFQDAVENIYNRFVGDCDVFYSHFINAGVTANYMGTKYKKPFFIANGESDLLEFIETLPIAKVKDTYNNVSGIISVSTANKEEVLKSGYFPVERENIIYVLPNGVDKSVFHKIDKKAAREKLSIAGDIFVAIFVGQFSDRKGSVRVAEALSNCKDVWSIFIGNGPAEPFHDKCLYKGKVNNSDVPIYLSAADVFVLPTLNEGCCNAIVEATACGLPVISSDRPFNYDILDKECAILVDPNNIMEIANAINKLRDDEELRTRMSEAALEKAASFQLDQRATNILCVMKNTLTTE